MRIIKFSFKKETKELKYEFLEEKKIEGTNGRLEEGWNVVVDEKSRYLITSQTNSESPWKCYTISVYKFKKNFKIKFMTSIDVSKRNFEIMSVFQFFGYVENNLLFVGKGCSDAMKFFCYKEDVNEIEELDHLGLEFEINDGMYKIERKLGSLWGITSTNKIFKCKFELKY